MVSEQPNEEAEMRNCKSAVRRVRNMEKDVDIACSNNGKRNELEFHTETIKVVSWECSPAFQTLHVSLEMLSQPEF
jgi:hypothetical protein